jgi:hypothetical protein
MPYLLRKGKCMRVHRIATIALILGVICVLSPVPSAGGIGVKFGFQAGINVAQSMYDPPDFFQEKELENKFRTVFAGGGVVTLSFDAIEYLSIESGLLVQMKGGTTHLFLESTTIIYPDPINMTYEMDWKLLYLTIPLHARFSIESGKITPYIKTGLDFDILLSATMDERKTINGSTDESEYDIKDDLTAFELGLVAGAGVEIPTGNRALLFFEATYCHGLTDILDPENAGYDGKVHNRVIGIMAGVRF